MCLAVPARIIQVEGDRALVEIDGLRRSAGVAFVDDPRPGDWVLLHAGFAIRKWSAEDVEEYRRIMAEVQQAEAAPRGAAQ